MKNNKAYNIPQTAEILKVHERTVRYWIRKGWVTPKRDYPVFTDSDIMDIEKWRNTLR